MIMDLNNQKEAKITFKKVQFVQIGGGCIDLSAPGSTPTMPFISLFQTRFNDINKIHVYKSSRSESYCCKLKTYI